MIKILTVLMTLLANTPWYLLSRRMLYFIPQVKTTLNTNLLYDLLQGCYILSYAELI